MHEPCVPTEGLLKCMDKKVCWFVSVFFGEGCLKARLSYEEGCCRVAVWEGGVTLWQRFWCGIVFEIGNKEQVVGSKGKIINFFKDNILWQKELLG